MGEGGEGLQQGHYPRITEAERRGALAVLNGGSLETVEGVLSEDTVVADALDFQELAIDLLAEVAQVREVGEPLGHVEILRAIDRGFGAEGVLLLEILLDVGRLIFDVKTGLHSVGNHPRAIAEGRRRRGMCETERKQEADPIRTSEIQILADHRFEEVAAVHGAVKHVGETEFDLPDREVMVVAGRSVSQRQRPWQAVRPAVEEGLDVSGPERSEERRVGKGWGAR